MEVLIVEDEKLAAENLVSMLESIDPSIKVLNCLESVRKTVEWLKSNSCDLIFMDIQLSDGNSFSIFEQVKVKIPVIFTTAYDQYAIKAFKHNSVDYLLKPINKEELAAGISKYREIHAKNSYPDLQLLIESIKKPQQYKERFMVGSGSKFKTVKSSEIAYIYVQSECVFICTHANKHYDIDFTLDKLEELLDPKQFFRINRQYIVNIEAIGNMVTVTKSRLQLDLTPKPPTEVIVSVNNVHDFRCWLNK